MAARIRAILERIKQEPGWLLLLIGALTLYVTYRLYKNYGTGRTSGGYVPTNGLDVPLYPSSVGGTPGNPSPAPSGAPGGAGTTYGDQLQNLLDALSGGGTVPTFGGVGVSNGGSSSGGDTTTTKQPVSASGNFVTSWVNNILSATRQIAAQARNATPPTRSAPHPQPSTTSPAPRPAGQTIGQGIAGTHFTVPTPSTTTTTHQLTHSDQLGY